MTADQLRDAIQAKCGHRPAEATLDGMYQAGVRTRGAATTIRFGGSAVEALDRLAIAVGVTGGAKPRPAAAAGR